MTKFKVGDKVRLVGKKWVSWKGYRAEVEFDPDAVYTVDEVDTEGNVYAGNAGVIEYGGIVVATGYEVELIEETDPTNPDPYKFGSGAMSTSHWDKTTHEEVTHVRGTDISELIAAAQEYENDPDATWAIEGGAVVFTRPMGEELIGRERKNR